MPDWIQIDEEFTEEHVDEICEMAEGKLKKTPLITEPQWIEKLNPKENDNG